MKKFLKITAMCAALACAFAFCGCSLIESIINPDRTDETTNDPNGTDNPDKPTETHSELLNDVIRDAYYVNLIKEHTTDAGVISTLSQDLAPIPYKFLEQQGYNINAIKNDQVKCSSISYVKENQPNNLYMSVKVETKASTPYYTFFTLKYSLSDLEMADLNYLHEKEAVEAPLFLQELSYQKTPAVEGRASMLIKAYDSILEYFQKIDILSIDVYNTRDFTMDVLSFSADNNILECVFRPNVYSVVNTTEIRYAHLMSGVVGVKVTEEIINGTNVYVYPYPYVSFRTVEYGNKYLTTSTPITLYQTEHENYLFKLYDDIYNKN